MHSQVVGQAIGQSPLSQYSRPKPPRWPFGAARLALLAAVLLLGVAGSTTARATQAQATQQTSWSPLFQQGLAAFPARPDDALDFFNKALPLARDNLQKALTYHMVARSYDAQGSTDRLRGAGSLYEKAQELFDGVMLSEGFELPPGQRTTIESFMVVNLQKLGTAYSQSLDEAMAEATLKRAVEVANANPDMPTHLVVIADLALSGHYARNERWQDAEALLEQAAAFVKGLPEHDSYLAEQVDDYRTKFIAFRAEHE